MYLFTSAKTHNHSIKGIILSMNRTKLKDLNLPNDSSELSIKLVGMQELFVIEQSFPDLTFPCSQ